jgi:hypothetical protein
MATECEVHCPNFCSARAATWREVEFATPEDTRRAWDRFEANWGSTVDKCPGPILFSSEVVETLLPLPRIRKLLGKPTIRSQTNNTYKCTVRR